MYMFKAFPVSFHLVAKASSNFSISNQFYHEDLFKLCAEHVAFGKIVVPGKGSVTLKRYSYIPPLEIRP
jgi:hypothetical protein